MKVASAIEIGLDRILETAAYRLPFHLGSILGDVEHLEVHADRLEEPRQLLTGNLHVVETAAVGHQQLPVLY